MGTRFNFILEISRVYIFYKGEDSILTTVQNLLSSVRFRTHIASMVPPQGSCCPKALPFLLGPDHYQGQSK
jgi:hypothetical protein